MRPSPRKLGSCSTMRRGTPSLWDGLVDDVVAGARGLHRQVAFGAECASLLRLPWMRGWPLRHQADEILLEQRLLVEAGLQVRHEADRQVDRAVLHVARGGGGDLSRCRSGSPGADARQVVEQARQQHDLADVGHADAELARARWPDRIPRGGSAHAATASIARRTSAITSCACGVGSMPLAVRLNRRSPKWVRSLPSAMLTRRLRQAEVVGRARHVAGLVDLIETYSRVQGRSASSDFQYLDF